MSQIVRVSRSPEHVRTERVDQIVRVVTSGPPGPPGPAGGGGGGPSGYDHTQTVAADTWTMNHNLGRRPVVELFTSGGVQFFAQIVHVSANQAVAYLNAPITGFARLT